jgi:hypothetical protein
MILVDNGLISIGIFHGNIAFGTIRCQLEDKIK